jgi:uncharacterized protein YaaN involved in tellurite resistance
MSSTVSLTQAAKTEKSIFDPSSLSQDERSLVQDYIKSLDPNDSNALITFGIGAQKDISDFTTQILEKVRTKDVGVIGDVLTELSVEVKKVDPKSLLAAQNNFLSGIPGIGFFFDKLQQFKAKYSSIESNINRISDKLDSQYDMMMRDIIMFDDLYKENLNYYHKLNIIIYAGQERVAQLEEELKAKELEYSKNPSELLNQEIPNLRNYLEQLENRIHDLELTRISAIQSFPQISLIKSADQGLASKIQSAVLNTIPLWKRHITIAIGLYNQQVVIQDLKNIDETTDTLLKNNSELLKKNSAEVARSLQKGIISIETLETVQNNLLESIDEVRDIVAEGRKERSKAKEKMYQLENELRDKLVNSK